ncbi:hypothetical protein [Methylobacterium fujisawaense]|uniref:hypothetical protein n=1 Tax=Methylobacterium fujisawaense TaxID=107400 RepID=UPI00313BA87D
MLLVANTRRLALISFSGSAFIGTAAVALDHPSVAAVAAAPKSFIGKSIGFRAASCVDDPKGGFICRVTSGSHVLRIEASALGAAGGDLVAERLIGPCKGRDQLDSPTCRFDIEIEPRSAQDEATVAEFEGERATRLYSGVIQMRLASRR